MCENANTIRVAAYCRVSTKLEEQEGSYELQVAHFTEKITANPNMVLVGIYGDNGKSGLRICGRPGLRELMQDCENGKIDLIFTKSISRFARNMADCAELIRDLRQLGIGVIFEKENINSKDSKCDLLLNILAALAQEESHSVSQNTRRAHEQYTMLGRPFGYISYGYYNAGENLWGICEAEAERVRTAFQMASAGCKYPEIVKELNALEHRDESGIIWKQRRVRYLLRNEVYKGDYYSHKNVCLVPGKSVKNKGFRDRYYIEEHHAPIVAPVLFDRVQEIITRGLLQSQRKCSSADKEFLQECDKTA